MSDSELGELYGAWREHKKAKKLSNYENSLAILDEKKISYKKLSDTHLRIGEFDYWPSTGLFIHMKTKKRGRGIFSLLKNL